MAADVPVAARDELVPVVCGTKAGHLSRAKQQSGGSGLAEKRTSGMLDGETAKIVYRYGMRKCLQCFDTVGWAAGRASGL